MAEEPRENLAAVGRDGCERLLHRQVRVEVHLRSAFLRHECTGLLRRPRTKEVDAEVKSESAQPRAERLRMVELSQSLVGANEHVLEDLLGVFLGETELARGDPVHDTGVPGDKLPPGIAVTGSTALDEFDIRERMLARRPAHRTGHSET
jgi:hypothetical protein